MRLVNVIVEQLIRENVKYVFGITAKAIFPLIDATLDYKVIGFVLKR